MDIYLVVVPCISILSYFIANDSNKFLCVFHFLTNGKVFQLER